jgi:hypothetical protein
MPDKTLPFEGMHCSAGEKSNKRVTVMIGCNADVLEGVPLFVKGKRLKLHWFKILKNYQ